MRRSRRCMAVPWLFTPTSSPRVYFTCEHCPSGFVPTEVVTKQKLHVRTVPGILEWAHLFRLSFIRKHLLWVFQFSPLNQTWFSHAKWSCYVKTYATKCTDSLFLRATVLGKIGACYSTFSSLRNNFEMTSASGPQKWQFPGLYTSVSMVFLLKWMIRHGKPLMHCLLCTYTAHAHLMEVKW